METWNKVDFMTPRDKVLLTKIVGEDGKERMEQKLILSGNLWWHTDMKMYVYYRPTHWKRV